MRRTYGSVFLVAVMCASAAEAKIADDYKCGSGMKIRYLNKMKEKQALEAILTPKWSPLVDGSGTTVTTARLERDHQGLGWFGIGDLHTGTFEYRIEYDAAATGARRYVVQVRNFYGKLVPGDLTFTAGGRSIRLKQFVSNATESERYNDRTVLGNQVYTSSSLHSLFLSRYEIGEDDVRFIAAQPRDSRLMSDQTIGQYGIKDSIRMCKITLLPLEFRYFLTAIERATNGPKEK